jgi:hypothetical protein
MARFDPNTYPDRLAFEAHARRIRTEEIGKAFCVAVAWLQGRQHELKSRLGKFAAADSTHSNRYLTR